MLSETQIGTLLANTAAVLGPAAGQRAEWRETLETLQTEAQQTGDADTAGLAAALLRLLDEGSQHVEAIAPDVPEAYDDAWARLVDLLRDGSGPTSDEELRRLAVLLVTWVQTPDWKASWEHLEAHRDDLLTGGAEMTLRLLIQANPDDQDLKEHVELLRLCRQKGIEAGYGEFVTKHNTAYLQRLADLLVAWMQAADRDASRAYLEAHRDDLLSDGAETALGILIEGNPGVDALVRHMELLRLCRRMGIDVGYGGDPQEGESVG